MPLEIPPNGGIIWFVYSLQHGIIYLIFKNIHRADKAMENTFFLLNCPLLFHNSIRDIWEKRKHLILKNNKT